MIDLPTTLFNYQVSNLDLDCSTDPGVPTPETTPESNSNMTELDFLDTDSCNDQWESICTSYEKSLSSLATKKRDLELCNDELVRINASLNANYKVLKATVFELSADKKELVTRITKLQNSLDYPREISRYGVYIQRQKQNIDERICAESWERNRIYEARVPGLKEDVNGTTTTTTTTTASSKSDQTVLDSEKHNADSLELTCNCGTTFKVSGDNLSSIKAKRGTCTTKSFKCKCQNKWAKNRTNTAPKVKDHDPLTPTSLRSLRSGVQNDPEMSEEMENLIRLIAIALVFVFLTYVARS